ncbi:MAG: hypothetical protein DMG61_17935 [Acidobacteria bacterium]|nr:MAG: hypothetical protein DMG61_17935 [Acidobacteriota bacterium]PYY19470.1 MAG: hypothetical protein DMG60_04230 [Acidobacteriota bacterium]
MNEAHGRKKFIASRKEFAPQLFFQRICKKMLQFPLKKNGCVFLLDALNIRQSFHRFNRTEYTGTKILHVY